MACSSRAAVTSASFTFCGYSIKERNDKTTLAVSMLGNLDLILRGGEVLGKDVSSKVTGSLSVWSAVRQRKPYCTGEPAVSVRTRQQLLGPWSGWAIESCLRYNLAHIVGMNA